MDAFKPITERPWPPAKWREGIAILGTVVLSDLVLYRGHGFTGLAVLFAATSVLLTLASPGPRFKDSNTVKTPSPLRSWSFWVVGVLLLASTAKLVWCGSPLLVVVAIAMLAAFTAALSGVCPHVLETVFMAVQIIPAGYFGLCHYERSFKERPRHHAVTSGRWLAVLLPLAAFVVFGLLFILANPNLVTFFRDVRQWLERFAPTVPEMLLWVATAWTTVGLLRPMLGRTTEEILDSDEDSSPVGSDSPSPWYAALRNTLTTVILLFAVYLAFEFNTLWFRVFPKGFYYSGYAHEGAAWLTVALALATLMLSLAFRGGMLQDPRLPRLRRLAWLWSLENMILAIAVYHRLLIYVGFNGMTRMRVIGFLGISAVVVGFAMVVWKIIGNHNFLWLIRRQLWTLALAVYLFALAPTDAIVVRYNVHRILAGDLAPSVQISVHPIDSEGVLQLLPLLRCSDPIISHGVAAMLAERQITAEQLAQQRRNKGWTAYQGADSLVHRTLNAHADQWSEWTKDSRRRSESLQKFRGYAYQWY
ncbi:MAG: DUF4173 domain-containing protein [Thermoguttaceae bacterium]